MKLLKHSIFFLLSGCILVFNSCDFPRVEVEYDCGDVATQITELRSIIGSYENDQFSNFDNANFDIAAILIEVADQSGVPDCFAFTPLPQLVETMVLTSDADVSSGGVLYPAGENLHTLFEIRLADETYTVADFILAHQTDPLIFHSDDHRMILQLLNKPDEAIDQNFDILFEFDDGAMLNVAIPSFVVTN